MSEMQETWSGAAWFVAAMLGRGLVVVVIALGLKLVFKKASAGLLNYIGRGVMVALVAVPLLWFAPGGWMPDVFSIPESDETILGPLQPVMMQGVQGDVEQSMVEMPTTLGGVSIEGEPKRAGWGTSMSLHPRLT